MVSQNKEKIKKMIETDDPAMPIELKETINAKVKYEQYLILLKIFLVIYIYF